MDIIKFNNPTAPTLMESGEIVNGLKSKMWIERYREAGEFKFVASADSGMKEKLPIGSFVSHIDTGELMIVENHEISENRDIESDIVISGRGYETFFENRIVGSNKVLPSNDGYSNYQLVPGYLSSQVIQVLDQHLSEGEVVNPDDALPYVSFATLSAPLTMMPANHIPFGTVYEGVMSLLATQDLGIRVLRRGPWSIWSPNTAFLIHEGEDKTATCSFSYDTGEIESADYLWSNKSYKNAAFISGRWISLELELPFGPTEYERRVMFIDASDIDGQLNDQPTGGGEISDIIEIMTERAAQILLAQRETALTKVEASKNAVSAKFRTDYNVGDWVTVYGSYDETAPMRVTEYVEIEDETGFRGYPTLTKGV